MVEFGKMLRRHVAAMKRIVSMASSYTGLFLIGDKAANRITHVQVANSDGNSIPLPLADYIARGVQPDYKNLPWREDVKP